MDTFAKFLATAFGAGYSPSAPGTCGTAVAVPIVWALAPLPAWQFGIVTVVATAIAIWAAHRADRAWGTHDSQRIVIDEVVGYMTTMALVDRGHWAPLAAGFVAFRFFDIVKPPPVRWIDEHLPGGWGVVLDDTAAGVLGMVTMIALEHFGALTWLGGLG
jgi:phosphatidylglycerophosphatase A